MLLTFIEQIKKKGFTDYFHNIDHMLNLDSCIFARRGRKWNNLCNLCWHKPSMVVEVAVVDLELELENI